MLTAKEQRERYALLMAKQGVQPTEPQAWRECLKPGDLVAVMNPNDTRSSTLYRVSSLTSDYVCVRPEGGGMESKYSKTTGKEFGKGKSLGRIVPPTAEEKARE